MGEIIPFRKRENHKLRKYKVRIRFKKNGVEKTIYIKDITSIHAGHHAENIYGANRIDVIDVVVAEEAE